jgi:hypothetical protein
MAYPPPPYKDAVCGVPICGEAICGTWWAYPARASLVLSGRQVTLVDPAIISIVPERGRLILRGRAVDFAGQDWLLDLTCIDLELDALECAVSYDPTILGTFKVGTKVVGGPGFAVTAPPAREISLQPAEAR